MEAAKPGCCDRIAQLGYGECHVCCGHVERYTCQKLHPHQILLFLLGPIRCQCLGLFVALYRDQHSSVGYWSFQYEKNTRYHTNHTGYWPKRQFHIQSEQHSHNLAPIKFYRGGISQSNIRDVAHRPRIADDETIVTHHHFLPVIYFDLHFVWHLDAADQLVFSYWWACPFDP